MRDSTFKKYCLVVDEWFVNGFNGAQAYKKFYPKASPDTATANFEKILRITEVNQYKKKKQDDATEMLGTSHIEILNELKNWLYADITETIGLSPLEIKELPIELRRLVSSYEHIKRSLGEEMMEETIKLKFISKEKALEIITKHIGFFEIHNQQKTVILTPEERAERIAALKSKMR